MTTNPMQTLLDEAHRKGLEAGQAATPQPMFIAGFAPVADGVCGFAWVTIPATGPLAKYVKALMVQAGARGDWHRGYPTGLTRWVHEFNQSLTRKEAYAYAFAKHLREAGFKAVSGSRID